MSYLRTKKCIAFKRLIYVLAKTKITHAIFEREGLLINTKELGFCDENIIFKRFDRHIPQELNAQFKPGEMNKTSELLVEGTSAPINRAGFHKVYHKTLIAESWRHAEIQPGVMELLTHLKRTGIPLAMVTHHMKDEGLVHAPKYKDLVQMFEHCIYRDDPEVLVVDITTYGNKRHFVVNDHTLF